MMAATLWMLWPGTSPPAADGSAAASLRFERETGIRVVRVALTAGDGLVDLRYQVIDPDRADVVHTEPPLLRDERTGAVVGTPFMGHSRMGEPKAGYSYPLLLVNEQGSIERGSSVSVLIGDSILEHVVVQ
jgi:hypothetical protein